jgi:hypothetical protein
MNYARIENGQLQRGLPSTGILTQVGFEGCATSNYDMLPYISETENIPSLKNEGWLPLVDNQPVYNPETEYLEQTEPMVTETEIILNYVVKAKSPVIPIPTVEDRVAAVEEALLMII